MIDDNELKRILALAEISFESEESDKYLSTDYVVDRIEAAYDSIKDPTLHVFRNAVAFRSDPIVSKSELKKLFASSGIPISYDTIREEIGDLIGTESSLVDIDHVSHLNAGVGAEVLDDRLEEANVYASLFNGGYRNDLAKAARAIEVSLIDSDIDSDFTVKAFDSRFAVLEGRVSFQNKIASVIVPLEIEGGIKMPSVFYGKGFSEFSPSNLKAWASAEGQVSTDAESVLDHLNSKAGPIQVVAYDEEWSPAVTSIPTDLGLMPNENVESFDMPMASVISDDLKSIAGADFEDIFNESAASCGIEKVKIAKTMLATQIKLAGVSSDKIVFESEFDGGVVLGTHIRTASGKAYVKVPVEFVGRSVAIPETFAYNNRALDFSSANLKALASSGESEYKTMASPLGQMKFADLHKIVIKCAQNHDLSGAEEAMNVILDNYGEEYYRGSFQDMTALMTAADTMEQGEFDKYASSLANGGEEIAHYVGSKVNLSDFGIL